jgi:predicted DsbA family dithiol-disulfide isomerase
MASNAGTMAVVSVDIISDVICPWCFVGKRRLEKAMAALPEGVSVAVRWRPFELNPQMPREGMERAEYRRRKFGSLEYSQKLDAQIAAVGAEVGIGFRHDLIRRTPNTFDAHRLLWLAEREGDQDALAEAMFRAYFVEGRDLGERAVLAELAASAGIDRGRAEAFLAGEEGADAVARTALEARRGGVSGVPTFIIDGEPAFSGAQQPEVMLAHLLDAAGPRA